MGSQFTVNGKTPDKVDVGLFGLGLFGGAAGPASVVTGVVKAVVDDDMDRRLKAVRLDEKQEARAYIKPCYHFSSSPPQISAMKIASMGGTAWQHPNGLWVYVTDANNYHIPNYKPARAARVYRPVWPLQSMGNGKFRYTSKRRLCSEN